MAEPFKFVIDKIKKNEKIIDKDKAIMSEVNDRVKILKDERQKKALFRELAHIEDGKYLRKYIGEPGKRVLVTREKSGDQLDPYYFWVLGFLKDDLGFGNFKKIIDTYSTSEASAFGREMGGATTAVQNQVVQTMRSVAEMTKGLFKMFRDLKVSNDQLSLMQRGRKFGIEKDFERHKGKIPKEKDIESNSAEIALKMRWTDLVDGGAQNPTSVFGLARQGGPGFTTLPKYFFHIHVFDPDDIDKVLKKYSTEMTSDLRDVLARKLQQYVTWRVSAENNYTRRRNIILKYLKQHYNAIKMNIQWLKPLLRTAQRFQQDASRKGEVDILAAIDQATMEVEVMALDKKKGDFNPIINIHWYYRTYPKTQYNPKFRGSSEITHTGRIEMEIMTRAMNDDQLLAYEVQAQEEDFELLGAINADISLALEEMGTELRNYLEERYEELPEGTKEEFSFLPGAKLPEPEEEKKKEKMKISGFFEPFIEAGKGVKELGQALIPIQGRGKKDDKKDPNKDKQAALETAAGKMLVFYDIFKKAHRMITW